MRRVQLGLIAVLGVLVFGLMVWTPRVRSGVGAASRSPSAAGAGLTLGGLVGISPEFPPDEELVPIPVVPDKPAEVAPDADIPPSPDLSRDISARTPGSSRTAATNVSRGGGGVGVPLKPRSWRECLPTSIGVTFPDPAGYRSYVWSANQPTRLMHYVVPVSATVPVEPSGPSPVLTRSVEPATEEERILARYRVRIETDPRAIPTQLQGFATASRQPDRFRRLLAEALARIHPGFVAPYHLVFIPCEKLGLPGHSYGGTYAFPQHVLIADARWEESTRKAIVHELSSFWFHHARFPREEYRASGPKDFRYFREREPPNNMGYLRLKVSPSDEWNAKGFATEYGTSSLEDDFEELSAFAILEPDRCKAAAAKLPAFARRLEAWKRGLRAISADGSLPVDGF